MLDIEEREFYREIVEKAQTGGDTRFEEDKRRIQELKAKREAERLEIVKQKRIQQYMYAEPSIVFYGVDISVF